MKNIIIYFVLSVVALVACFTILMILPNVIQTRLRDDIEIVLMKTFSTSKNIPLTLQYDAKDLSLEDLKSKIDSLRRVNPEYAVFVDSLDSVTSCDTKGNDGSFDYYDMSLYIPEFGVYIGCYVRSHLLRITGYNDGAAPKLDSQGKCQFESAHYQPFGVEQRRNRDKRQREVIEAIDKVVQKIDESITPHELYIY